MVMWAWLLLSLSEAPSEFLRAWSASDFAAACRHLDAGEKPLIDAQWRALAVSARMRCGKDALAQGRWLEARAHQRACAELNSSPERCVELGEMIQGWEALMAARQGTLRSAVEKATQVPSERWPSALPVELLRMGGDALRKRQVEEAQATVTLLEARAPDTFGLAELRSALWWATQGTVVAFRIALAGFMLLLALTLRSLLRTRRRAKVLLGAEMQS